MDPKDLRANAPLSISVSDDTTKFAHSSPTLPANKSRSYHEIGSTSMGKVNATAVRPCAIIGPDRVLPQTSDVYLKKSVEPWPCSENIYRQPPDYPNRLSDYSPIRNISPRQTFQENMQRIMVPPSYNSLKNSDDNSNLKNPKLNMPQEAKYCDVPYNMNSVSNELKSVRNNDIPMPSVNPAYGRSVPHYGWPGGVNIRPPRPYGASEIYPYPEYPSCVGPRPVTISHPHSIHSEDTAQVYSERLYQEANIRFKPYPTLKEKHQQARYDYINNYKNSFHPPHTFPPHKYELQKSLQTNPYPMYPQVPLKYLDRRIHETFVDGYQRSNQQPNFNPQFTHNPVIHPPYGPISGNCVQNKSFVDLPSKPMTSNRIQHETNNKTYFEDPSRNKGYPVPENVYFSDANHAQHLRNEILLPNRSTLNMHPMQQHQIYRRDNLPIKHHEYNPHYRNIDQSVNLNYSLSRLPLQYSPNMFAISPSDSNTSNDTTHTIGTSQEDCGYVSQSSTNSVRSLDAFSKDMYRRHDYNMHALPRSLSSSDKISKNKNNSSNKKNIDVRQFLQMWNEGEDETNESSKETVHQIHPSIFPTQPKTIDNQEQLYVLGLVNVPSEELSKYEHIQKISELPENIKGYNSIELLNQYEELLEKPSNNNYKVIPKVHKDHSSLSKRPNDTENNTLPRSVSPLDVEAKISQSVIHKEVGCNFEIKPCSPEMLHVEVATPIQNILGERIIEKITNPITSKLPILPRNDDIKPHNSDINTIKIASCDIINKQYPGDNYGNIAKNNNFNVQDFESNSGLSLASLPRLDNDIELNFPEINQQFIKANNIETEAHLFQKDLTQLNQTTQEKSTHQQQSSLSPQFCLGSAPEKQFSKLSKYRKNKKCDMIPKDDVMHKNIVAVQQRINSVIIKNPDTKLQEEIEEPFTISNKTTSENSHYNYTEQDHEKLFSSFKPENSKDEQTSFDTAIDFSLNKSETDVSYDCISKINAESHNSGDKHQIIFNENDKDNVSKDHPLELRLKQLKDQETVQENVNKKPIEYSEINDNNTVTNGISVPKAHVQELHVECIEDHKAMEENINNEYEHSDPINEPHYSANNCNISFSPKKEFTSRDEGEELHQRKIKDREATKENIFKEAIENTEIQVEENNALITHESYDDLNKCSVEPHYFDMVQYDSQDTEIHTETISMKQSEELHDKQTSYQETIKENIINNIEPLECTEIHLKHNNTSQSYVCFNKFQDEQHSSGHSNDITFSFEENDITKEEHAKLHLKLDKDHEIAQENIINKESIENSEIQGDINITSAAFKQPINTICKENNIPSKKNILVISEFKDYLNVDTNTTCVRPEDESLLDSSIKIKLHRMEKINEKKIMIVTETFSHVEKIEPTSQCKIKSEEDDNFKGKINKSYELCEMDPGAENTAVKTMLNGDIEINMIEENVSSSIGSSEELEYTKVLVEIEKNKESHNREENILKMISNYDKNERETCTGSHSTDGSNLNNQTKDMKIITNEDCHLRDNVISNANQSTLNVNDQKDFDEACNEETNDEEEMINKITHVGFSKPETDEVNNDNKILINVSNVFNELSDCSQHEYSRNKISSLTKNDYENICNNDLASTKENKIITNYPSNVDTKFIINKTNNILIYKEKQMNKELFSPWIQKLIVFEDGILGNIQNKTIGTTPAKVGSSFQTTDTKLNEFTDNKVNEQNNEPNNLIEPENLTNEEQNNCPDDYEKNFDCNKTVPTNDLSILSEDNNSKIEENTTASECAFRRNILKRSLSESALDDYKEDESIENFVPNKRKKRNHNIIHPVTSEDLCNIIQTNRRNSISTFYNDDNVFILIDNDLIVAEENDGSDKMFYTEIPHEFENNIQQNDCIVDETTTTIASAMTSLQSDLICEEKPNVEPWVEDVACIETVVSDDITDDIDYVIGSPIKLKNPDENINDQFEFCDYEHMDKIKNSYSSNMCSNDTQILKTLYMTPQMNVNKALLDIESHSAKYQEFNKTEELPSENSDYLDKFEDKILTYNNCEAIYEKENINTKDIKIRQSDEINNEVYVNVSSEYTQEKEKITLHSKSNELKRDSNLHSPKRTVSNYSNSSSPEVSSTTEEKNSNILLKFNNNNDSRISNEIDSIERLRYKLTENKKYQNYNTNFSSSRTLITKAAQKYIPPLKESSRDLKIKLPLPQHRLQTLKQLKVSKVEPKIDDSTIKYSNKNAIPQVPKKIKPKFEDVLKSIDEIQFKKRKDKVKKGKNGIPKVVIKKNENGAHFASCKTANDKEIHNPDLTGRKWQPWVFLEKNNFIDKMAVRNKVKAVYCHRKNNYVLAEKFRKYKSIYNANFVISQPSPDNSITGTLKYTIRLKHK